MNKVKIKPYSKGDKEIDFVINDVYFTLDFDDVDHVWVESMMKALAEQLKASPKLTETKTFKTSLREALIEQWNDKNFEREEYNNDIEEYLSYAYRSRGLKYEN